MKEEFPYTPLYYGTPCQIRFYDAATANYYGGIAYQDVIFCGCCGSTIPIEDVIKNAVRANVTHDDAVVELEWKNISDIIKG